MFTCVSHLFDRLMNLSRSLILWLSVFIIVQVVGRCAHANWNRKLYVMHKLLHSHSGTHSSCTKQKNMSYARAICSKSIEPIPRMLCCAQGVHEANAAHKHIR